MHQSTLHSHNSFRANAALNCDNAKVNGIVAPRRVERSRHVGGDCLKVLAAQ
jgi:hypothetical protein